jgi:O-antigen ligase
MIHTLARPHFALPKAKFVAIIGLAAAAGLGAGAAVSLINPLHGLLAVLGAGAAIGICLLPAGRFWLLAAVTALLPFGVIPINFGVQVTLLDALMALLLGVALVRFLTRAQAGVGTPLDLPILVFIALCFVSFVLGTAYGVTGETARYFLKILFAILVFFALTNGLTSLTLLDSYVNSLIIGSFGSALIAIVLNLAGQATADRLLSSLAPLGYPTGNTLRFIASTNIWRATSTSVDPNIFGGLLMVGIMLLLGRLLAALSTRRPAFGTLLGVPALAVMAWALLLSYSRGAWVGLAAGVAFLAVLRYRKALPALALAGILAVVGLGNTEFGSHLVSGFRVEDQASAMRIGEYRDALNFISEYPLFGVGFGTTPNGTSAITPEADIYVGVSNIYLLMALEVGLVGTAGFAAIIITLAAWAWRRYRQTDALGKARIATGAASLFAAGVAGIADHYFFRFPHMIALFWSVIAILAIAVRLAPKPTETSAPASAS